MIAAAPLIPDGDEARRWAEQELADPIYREAEPTAFDRFARAVGDFLGSLFAGGAPSALTPWIALVVIAVLAGIVVLAFVVWGRPRRAVRSRIPIELFGTADARSAAELRSDATDAAGRGDWDEALVLRFRALARGLVERAVLDPEPGATVHGFARAAAEAFPGERHALATAADRFDDVRYLKRHADADAYRALEALDGRIGRTAPQEPAESFAGAPA